MFNDVKKNTLILRPPNFQTRVLAIIVLLSFIAAMLGAAYLVALDKDQIDSHKFTISQALAHGSKEIMVPLFIVALFATVLLNYIRGGEPYLLVFRIMCTFLIYTMMIALIWITVEEDKATHFHIAGTIFTFITVYIFAITYLFNNYLPGYNADKMLLDLNMVLLYCSFVLLLVFGIFDESDKSEFNSIMFAGNENITVFLNFVPLFYLGFI